MITYYKSAFASKGVWGGLIAVAAGLLAVFGYSISPADQVQLVNLVAGLISAIGGILAIIGRIRATKRIG